MNINRNKNKKNKYDYRENKKQWDPQNWCVIFIHFALELMKWILFYAVQYYLMKVLLTLGMD